MLAGLPPPLKATDDPDPAIAACVGDKPDVRARGYNPADVLAVIVAGSCKSRIPRTGPVAENIAYGAPGASFDDIVQAARLADADSFIGELPDGYRTGVGSRGVSLSAGQCQRIGLARVLVRRPQILILDEAMNAVDGISEITIMSLLRDRSWDKTTIVISHRQSTLACCENGIVLEKGRVIESGPLASLAYYNRMNIATGG